MPDAKQDPIWTKSAILSDTFANAVLRVQELPAHGESFGDEEIHQAWSIGIHLEVPVPLLKGEIEVNDDDQIQSLLKSRIDVVLLALARQMAAGSKAIQAGTDGRNDIKSMIIDSFTRTTPEPNSKK